ncbi:uncharacterized protein BDV14DRAFT_195284 [Aspergillus stella-maris]|uniref:uncharacterized protein n=1 Tax=Aspergillus stella-maris TaxID=1810926 RepID=UPI003CCE4581
MRLLLTIFFTLLALVVAAPTPDTLFTFPIDINTESTNTTTSTLSTRVTHDLKCTLPNRARGKKSDLNKAISWLRKERTKESKPKLGGGECQTASCVKGMKIKWCNDNKGSKSLPSWINIAEGAAVIADNCKEDEKVMGELDHNDHWRAVVYAEDCYMQPGPDGPGSG